MFMRHMALSNTVRPFHDEGKLKFQAESAEEKAMCEFAETCGFVKTQLEPTTLEIIDQDGTKVTEQYLHVATLGFTSQRARVTVIYQAVDTNMIHVMTKGQDTVVLPLLTDVPASSDLHSTLTACSNNGLRTLVCGYATLPTAWWLHWAKKYTKVVEAPEEHTEGHPSKCKPKQCSACKEHKLFEDIEKEAKLKYLGVVGMEDQLQELVPETIHDLLQADINVWMITGDKLETAKNIGMACNLINADMVPHISPDMKLKDACRAFSESRLIEITGQWCKLANDSKELVALFRGLQMNSTTGRVRVSVLLQCLDAFGFKADHHQVIEEEIASDFVTEQQFIALMEGSSATISLFDAVKYDIQAGKRSAG
jgi:magnesium-transporting ATPase (P-type)